MNKAKDQSPGDMPQNPVLNLTADAMAYYTQLARIEVDGMFSGVPDTCYSIMVAGYLTAAATIHASHVQAIQKDGASHD